MEPCRQYQGRSLTFPRACGLRRCRNNSSIKPGQHAAPASMTGPLHADFVAQEERVRPTGRPRRDHAGSVALSTFPMKAARGAPRTASSTGRSGGYYPAKPASTATNDPRGGPMTVMYQTFDPLLRPPSWYSDWHGDDLLRFHRASFRDHAAWIRSGRDGPLHAIAVRHRCRRQGESAFVEDRRARDGGTRRAGLPERQPDLRLHDLHRLMPSQG